MFSVGKQVGAADACSLSLAGLLRDTCTAREQHLYGSRAVQAILVGIASNTRQVCRQYSWALWAEPGGIACYMRRDCLLLGRALLVEAAYYGCYAAKVDGYVRQVALCG